MFSFKIKKKLIFQYNKGFLILDSLVAGDLLEGEHLSKVLTATTSNRR